jgi:hypothetical protein
MTRHSIATDRLNTNWLAYGVYTAVALAVLLPLLRPGFVLTLDMVFTPHIPLPDSVGSSYLFHAFLHALNFVVPADIIEKIVLLAALILPGIGMHRLLQRLGAGQGVGGWGVYAASLFYTVNPFTYDRFMAGQYSVLLGYALLPWCLSLMLACVRHPDKGNALRLGLMVAAIATISIHTLGEVAVLAAVGGAVLLVLRRGAPGSSLLLVVALAAVPVIVLCGFWLVPLATGHGATARTIDSFSAADTTAFQTTGGSTIGKLGNVLRLQGFWTENRQLYLQPRDRTLLWGLQMVTLLTLVGVGVVALWRAHPNIALVLGVSGLVAILIAIGAGGSWLGRLGYREPQKFVGLLALSYSVYVAYGTAAVLRRAARQSTAAYTTGAVIILLLPLLSMRVFAWGGSGQLQSSQYPDSWRQADAVLAGDPDRFNSLFLPWHQYMSFNFAGRIIANPAPDYFSRPIVSSHDPEFGNASGGPKTPAEQAVEKLMLSDKNSEIFGRQLAQNNIKYVLLAKELDYRQYAFVTQSSQFHIVRDYPDLTIFENTAWRKQ